MAVNILYTSYFPHVLPHRAARCVPLRTAAALLLAAVAAAVPATAGPHPQRRGPGRRRPCLAPGRARRRAAPARSARTSPGGGHTPGQPRAAEPPSAGAWILPGRTAPGPAASRPYRKARPRSRTGRPPSSAPGTAPVPQAVRRRRARHLHVLRRPRGRCRQRRHHTARPH